MLLAIDAGNTNTLFAIFHGNEIKAQWRTATNASRTADDYGIWLSQLLTRANIPTADITDVIIASVVPQANFSLRTLARTYFSCEALVIGESNVDLGIVIKLPRPQEVGADRLVNAVAALRQWKTPLIVLDFGTATTFDIVDTSGAYAGGVIAPGVNLSLQALHKATAKLPNVAIEKPKAVIGTDTISAMQSGLYYGYLSFIEGMLTRIEAEMDGAPTVIATGGLASLFAHGTSRIHHLAPDLTILGLKAIFENRKNHEHEF